EGVRENLSLNDAILSTSRMSSPESMKLMTPPLLRGIFVGVAHAAWGGAIEHENYSPPLEGSRVWTFLVATIKRVVAFNRGQFRGSPAQTHDCRQIRGNRGYQSNALISGL